MKQKLMLFLSLVAFWLVLAGTIDLRQILSALVAALATLFLYEWILKRARIKPIPPLPKIRWHAVLKISIFSVLKSAYAHIKRILWGDEDIVFIQVALETKHPYVNAFIANIITLTPGAVSVELDGQLLKVMSYAPHTEKERQDFYHLVDELQDAFGRASL